MSLNFLEHTNEEAIKYILKNLSTLNKTKVDRFKKSMIAMSDKKYNFSLRDSFSHDYSGNKLFFGCKDKFDILLEIERLKNNIMDIMDNETWKQNFMLLLGSVINDKMTKYTSSKI